MLLFFDSLQSPISHFSINWLFFQSVIFYSFQERMTYDLYLIYFERFQVISFFFKCFELFRSDLVQLKISHVFTRSLFLSLGIVLMNC